MNEDTPKKTETDEAVRMALWALMSMWLITLALLALCLFHPGV